MKPQTMYAILHIGGKLVFSVAYQRKTAISNFLYELRPHFKTWTQAEAAGYSIVKVLVNLATAQPASGGAAPA